MKKEIVILFLVIFSINFVYALNLSDNLSSDKISLDFKNKTSGVLNQTEMPESVRKVSSLIFRVDKSEMNWHFLILFSVVAIFVFLILYLVLDLFPSLSRTTVLITSIAVTALFSGVSLVKYFSLLLFNFWDVFSFFEDSPTLKLVLSLVFLIVVAYFLGKLFKTIKNSVLLGKASEDGSKAGMEIAKLSAMADMEAIHRKR